MTKLTDEDCDALDDYYTKNTIMPDMSKPGYFSAHKAHLVEVDDLSAGWLRVKAEATRKSTAQIIGEMVREKIAAQAL
jgi:hypothetical protein